jgi:serine protease Do
LHHANAAGLHHHSSTGVPMMTCRLCLCWIAAVLCSTPLLYAANGVKEGKDATVLVDLGEDGSGSGFCLDAKGLFVTNRHVIASVLPGAKVKVIYHPSEPDQRVIEATVVARSAKYDLAILKAEEPGTLTAVQLGDDSNVTETDTVTAFGYPFGKMLASKQGEYPAVSINTGKVTALRHEGKTLARLQIDATVNPGNSGGPVFDAAGKVIGIVVSGIQYNGQTGVNFAIPVSQLRKFLEPAYVELAQPAVQYSSRHEEAEFVASIFQYGKPDADLTVELTLTTPGTAARKFAFKRKSEGTYSVTAIPVPETNDATLLPVTALTTDGLKRGWVKDHEITVAGQGVKLSELKSITTLPNPTSIFLDGHQVVGGVSKLGQFNTGSDDSDQPVSVDLSTAVSIRLDDPSPPDAVVRYQLSAQAAGKPVGENRGTFTLQNAPGETTNAGPKLPEWLAAMQGGDEEADADASAKTQTLLFSNDIDQAMCAGAGRFEVIHLRGLRTYAVVDLLAGKVSSWVTVDSPDAVAAAGLNDLIVTTVDRHGLMRFDLRTGRLIETVYPARAVIFRHLAMGDASNGPVIADVGTERMLLQLPGFREIPPNWTGGIMSFADLCVSGDGTTIAGWDNMDVHRVHISNDRVTGRFTARSVGGVQPDYDGSHLYSFGMVLDRSLNPLSQDEDAQALPTHSIGINAGMSLGFSEGGMGGQMMLLDSADNKPLCPLFSIADLMKIAAKNPGQEKQKNQPQIDSSARLSIAPQGGVAMILPTSDDRVIIRRFDLDNALARNGGDWLVVASNPPTGFVRGEPYAYAIDVRAAHKPLRFALETAPAGMTISADGKISWLPAKTISSDRLPVVVSITDSAGKLKRHAFVVERRSDPQPAAPADAAGAAAAFQRALCMDDLSLAKQLATTAGGDSAAIAAIAAKPLESLDETEAKQLGDWYSSLFDKSSGDLKSAASEHAGRYLNLYLAMHGDADAARQSAEMELKKLPSTGTVDLIDTFRQSNFVIEGKVAITDAGVHILTPTNHPRVVTYTHCRQSYRFHYEFTPTKAKEVVVTFPVGEGSGLLNLGGWEGVAALCTVSTAPHGRFEIKPWKMENGHAYKVDVSVLLKYEDARITVDVDGKRLLDWSGRQKDIRIQTATWDLPYLEGICLCGGDVTFTAATLTPLDGGVHTPNVGSARDFSDTYLSELSVGTGVTATAQNLTLTPKGAAGCTAPYALQGNFDRFSGAVRLPAVGTGGGAIVCDGVVKWRTSSAHRDADQPFLLDVHDVKRIEITTTGEPAAWIAPRLRQSDEPIVDPNSPLWASVKNAGDHQAAVASQNVGGAGGNPFEEIFPDGGVLVGMRMSFFPANNDWYVRSLQAVYQTPDGERHTGILHGAVGSHWQEEVAQPGYAVGSIDAVGGQLFDGFRMQFMRIGPDAMQADGSEIAGEYRGKQQNLNEPVVLGVKGRPIIGIRGRAGDGIDALGVLTAP